MRGGGTFGMTATTYSNANSCENEWECAGGQTYRCATPLSGSGLPFTYSAKDSNSPCLMKASLENAISWEEEYPNSWTKSFNNWSKEDTLPTLSDRNHELVGPVRVCGNIRHIALSLTSTRTDKLSTVWWFFVRSPQAAPIVFSRFWIGVWTLQNQVKNNKFIFIGERGASLVRGLRDCFGFLWSEGGLRDSTSSVKSFQKSP